LNMSAIETTLNTLYPQLARAMFSRATFRLFNRRAAYRCADWGGHKRIDRALANSDTGLGAYGSSSAPKDGESGVLGSTGKPFTFTTLTTIWLPPLTSIAGVWGDTTGQSQPRIYEKAAGVLATADDAYAGAFYNNSAGNYTVWAEALGARRGWRHPQKSDGRFTASAFWSWCSG